MNVELVWEGKQEAINEACKPIPQSHDFDLDFNYFIEADNLIALRAMQKSYHKKIKMIYIDPPYNTGNKFIYDDKMSHSDWLSMMYPRLKLARELLTDDGVIFISIDDNEQAYLKVLMDEVFGRENFVGNIAWESKTKSQNTKDAFNKLQPKIEFILVYAKQTKVRFNLVKTGEKIYTHTDQKGAYRFALIEQMSSVGIRARDSMIFPILGVHPKKGRQWKIGIETIKRFQERMDLLLVGGKPCLKLRPDDERTEQTDPFWAFFSKDIGTTESAKKQLKELIGENGFETVKPVTLIKQIIFSSSHTDSIILDFFAGSGTTAHSVMKLNAEDGGNRKYIMVQCAEKIDKKKFPNSEFETIADIGKERIRRAKKKIEAETGKILEDFVEIML